MSKRNRKQTQPKPAEQAEAIEQTEAVQAAAAEAIETPEAEAELPPNRSVVPRRWIKAYNANELKGTCGDRVAYALEEATKTDGKPDLAKINALGAANGIDVQARWGKRNVGMQRMNLGNMLRGRIKRNEPVHGLAL